MKSKTLTLVMSRLSRKNKDQDATLDKSRLKVEIEKICEEYLESSGDLIEFEVQESDLDDVISIVETGMISKYDIFQMDKTIFSAQLKEVDLI